MKNCNEHNCSPGDEAWKVGMEELAAEEGEFAVQFMDHVCPLCYIRLIEKYKRARREAKIEGRKSLRATQEQARLESVVKAVVETVKQLTGKDAFTLASAKFPVSPIMRKGYPGMVLEASGELVNILPNLINEAIKGAKQGTA